MNIKYTLSDRYTKRSGKASIYVTVHIGGKTLQFKTGVQCEPQLFDKKKGKIKGQSKAVKDDNLIIHNVVSQLNEIYVRYRLQNKELTPVLLKQEYQNPSYYIDFFLFLEKTIQQRFKDKEISKRTFQYHNTTLNKLKGFKKELTFSEITPRLIKQYAGYCRRAPLNNSTNTVHKELKVLKTYLTIACMDGIIKDNPFEFVTLPSEETDIVNLTESELKKLYTAYNNKTLKESDLNVLRHFLFMCFTSVRISDLKELKKENIYNKTLNFVPIKTRNKKVKELHIKLSKKALSLISDENSPNCYLFNTISDQKMNKYLKEIAEKLEIKKKVTNHVGRHTFATLFIEKTHDVSSLQRILGHSKVEDTMKYVHVSEQSIKKQMEKFNQLLDL